jgi:hypothetical protein
MESVEDSELLKFRKETDDGLVVSGVKLKLATVVHSCWMVTSLVSVSTQTNTPLGLYLTK